MTALWLCYLETNVLENNKSNKNNLYKKMYYFVSTPMIKHRLAYAICRKENNTS